MEPLLRIVGPALSAAICVPLIHIPIMRIRRHESEALAWTAVSFAGSFSLWLLLTTATREPRFPDMLSSLCFLAFLWLGYLELMFKLYRGFSYTLLTDIGRMQPVTEETLSGEFAEGTGMDGMLQRRIATLAHGGLLRQEENALLLTEKGRQSARLTSRFKSFLRLGRGG